MTNTCLDWSLVLKYLSINSLITQCSSNGVSLYELMSSTPDKRPPWWNPITSFINDPCRGQTRLLSNVQLRRSVSDWKMTFSSFWGANGWRSPRGVLLSELMAAANDQVWVTWGAHHTWVQIQTLCLPGVTSDLWFIAPAAAWEHLPVSQFCYCHFMVALMEKM